MSKKSKKRVQQERRLEKTKKKNAKKALYASYVLAGKDNSKRQTLRAKKHKVSPNKHRHFIGICGNPGCKQCVHFLIMKG